MAPNPKNPRQPRPPRKPNSGGGGRSRGRPRKNHAEEAEPKRPNMPLPASLLDTTITDGEEYRPGTGAPAEDRSEAPERGNEQIPPPPPPSTKPSCARPASLSFRSTKPCSGWRPARAGPSRP